MTPPYFVHGIQLVNVGGERCEVCRQRPAVGPSISGSLLCAPCARDFAQSADEMARERVA